VGRAGRGTRNLAAVALAAGLIAGTVWWQTDDTWPLAQMRMFPGGPESAVAILAIEGMRADGHRIAISPGAFHLKRAEIEGQLDRVAANTQMLGDLFEYYNGTAAPQRRIVRLLFVRREAVVGPGPQRTPTGLRAPPGRHWVQREVARWPV
jgi:hypothetical protein